MTGTSVVHGFSWRDAIGWFDWMDLYDEVALTTPAGTSVVEVGVAFGRSLLYLAEKIKETGKDIRVIAVDPWLPYSEHHFLYDGSASNESERAAAECVRAHSGIFPAFLHNLYRSGLADIVQVVRADSVTASRMFAPDAHPAYPPHFVFIDADHHEEMVRRDIDYWWETGPEWMAGHDFNPKSEIHFPGVWRAVFSKWPEQQIEWRGQTCWVARRSTLATDSAPFRYEYLK